MSPPQRSGVSWPSLPDPPALPKHSEPAESLRFGPDSHLPFVSRLSSMQCSFCLQRAAKLADWQACFKTMAVQWLVQRKNDAASRGVRRALLASPDRKMPALCFSSTLNTSIPAVMLQSACSARPKLTVARSLELSRSEPYETSQHLCSSLSRLEKATIMKSRFSTALLTFTSSGSPANASMLLTKRIDKKCVTLSHHGRCSSVVTCSSCPPVKVGHKYEEVGESRHTASYSPKKEGV